MDASKSVKAIFAVAPLPATGQTISYAVGDDGNLRTGIAWPTPRFSDNSDQTITDKLTGLVWSKDTNPAGVGKAWQDSLDYIKQLNNQNYLGHSDWRLPNVNELRSVVNYREIDFKWLQSQGFSNI